MSLENNWVKSCQVSKKKCVLRGTTSQNWSWMLWRWRHLCSGLGQGSSCSLETLISSAGASRSLKRQSVFVSMALPTAFHYLQSIKQWHYLWTHGSPWRILAGHMSILVTTTKTGTLRANAKPRCSLVMPTIPALLPICDREWKGVNFKMSSIISSLYSTP